MISIVLVSHSRALAQALVELIRQFAKSDVKIAIAAGAGKDHQEFGTDAAEIAQVIQSVDTADGVLVLMEMGSAVLSAEMALDFLPEEIRQRTLLCPAPFVEGAFISAVQAGVGSDLQTVAQEAQRALTPKIQQLEPPMSTIFPESIHHLPQADIPLQGVTAYLSQAENHQIIFMEFSQDVEVGEHSHESQWGIVLEGRIDLTMAGIEKTYIKGDRYFIPKGVKHAAKIHAGYADITYFNQVDRYTIKKIAATSR